MPEGMVHALREVQRVLRPGGTLIDLRPGMHNRTVELALASARLHIGEIDSSNTVSDHLAADEALRNAIDAGKFRAEHSTSFEYVTTFDTLEDLQEYASTMRRSSLPESVIQQIERLTADESDDFVIRIRREMIIARYKKLPEGRSMSEPANFE